MKFEDFVIALQTAGWEAVHDAQHNEIKVLWSSMYPVIAELQNELEESLEFYSNTNGKIVDMYNEVLGTLATVSEATTVLGEHNTELQNMFTDVISCLDELDEDEVPENTFRHLLIALKQA